MKTIFPDNHVYKFSPDMKACDVVKTKQKIMFITKDCFSNQVDEQNNLSSIDMNCVNPATGPVFIENAEIGDVLKVKIHDITLNDSGSVCVINDFGLLGSKVDCMNCKIVKVDNQYVHFNNIKIPIKPMIGVIGVATSKEDGDVLTGTPGRHGSNMDTTDIGIDSTLYLPVYQKGAMFALGDLHAVMGDGEMSGTGLEIAGKVIVEFDLIKQKQLEMPLLETNSHVQVLASGNNIEHALELAGDYMVRLLQQSLNLTWEDSYMLASLAVDLKISQVVNPKITVRASVEKSILGSTMIFNGIT